MAERQEDERIQIYLRLRPVKQKMSDFRVDASSSLERGSIIEIKRTMKKSIKQEIVNNSLQEYKFQFDGIFNTDAAQDEVFEKSARQCVMSSMEGYNSTIFAYGQTGSGKTFTMTELVFQEISSRTNMEWEVSVSYVQVYNNIPYDLLSKTKKIKDVIDLNRLGLYEDKKNGFAFSGLENTVVRNSEEALEKLFVGDQNRALSETEMNEASSRSHCIFTLYIQSKEPGATTVKVSKLHLVDLAGSERVDKSGSTGQTLTEAKFINKSLLSLQRVIVALTEKHDHIPYRDSAATMILKDSLGGNCKTVMIAAASPAIKQLEETISTCKFAQNVASIKQKAMVNENVDPTIMVGLLKKKMADMEEELKMLKGDGKESNALSENDRATIKEKIEVFVADPDQNAILKLGGSHLKIKEAFKIFKYLLQQERKRVAAAKKLRAKEEEEEKNKVTNEKTKDLPQNIQLQIQNLIHDVQLRDREIDMLVQMVNKKNESSAEVSIQTEDDALVPPSATLFSRPSIKQAFVERVSPAPIETEKVLKRIDTQKQQLMKKKPEVTYINEKLAEMAKERGAADRAKAFEAFRKNYERSHIIEQNKKKLQGLIKQGKAMAESLKKQKMLVSKRKEALVQLKTEMALSKIDNENSEVDAHEEELLKEELLEAKETYDSLVKQMTDMKTETKFMINQIEKDQQRLNRDFERWLEAVNYKETGKSVESENNDELERESIDSVPVSFYSSGTTSTTLDSIDETRSEQSAKQQRSRSFSEESVKPLPVPKQAWGSDTRETTLMRTNSQARVASRESQESPVVTLTRSRSSSSDNLLSRTHTTQGSLHQDTPPPRQQLTKPTPPNNDFHSKLQKFMNMQDQLRKSDNTSDQGNAPKKKLSLLERARLGS